MDKGQENNAIHQLFTDHYGKTDNTLDDLLTAKLQQYNETNIIDDTEYYIDYGSKEYRENRNNDCMGNILLSIFDQEIFFTKCGNMNFTHITNLFKLNNIQTSCKRYDRVCDAYLRFKFLYKPTDEDIRTVLSLLSNVNVLYEISEDCKIVINLGQNILLAKLLKKDINIFDTEEFLNNISTEEHMHLCYKYVNDYCIGTCKYYFDDDNGYYLDIPLLDDFYFCGNSGNTVGKQEGIKLTILPMDKENQLYKYISSTIYYGFERIYVLLHRKRTRLAYIDLIYPTLKTHHNTYFICHGHNANKIWAKSCKRCKFIFISITSIDTHIAPTILSTHISYDGKSELISDDNIELYEFNNTTLYAMSVDTNYAMNDLTDYVEDCVGIMDIINDDQIKLDNLNSNNKRTCIDIDNVEVLLSDNYGYFDINITLISQEMHKHCDLKINTIF
jgi:hypothetical protein